MLGEAEIRRVAKAGTEGDGEELGQRVGKAGTEGDGEAGTGGKPKWRCWELEGAFLCYSAPMLVAGVKQKDIPKVC